MNPSHKYLRQKLRREMTPAERLVWNHIRANALGVSFRRQHSIGPYIADFYCSALHLAIEIDGDPHFLEEGQVRDKVRDAYFAEHGIRTLRFTNNDIYENFEAVLEMLLKVCLEQSPSQPPPLKKGEGSFNAVR